MTRQASFFIRVGVLLGAAILGISGCGADAAGGGPQGPDGGSLDGSVSPPSNLASYTLSYRSQVRVPADGVVMPYDDFAAQVSRLDPIAAKRCPVSNSAQFEAAVDALGGINWTHPVDILKDLSLPPLYQGHIPPATAYPAMAGEAKAGQVPGAACSPCPPIARFASKPWHPRGRALDLACGSGREAVLAIRTSWRRSRS